MSEIEKKVRVKPSFDEGIKERALLALAAHSGNGRRAAETLAAEGIHIDNTTLYRWKTIHAADYARVCAQVLPQIRERQAEAHRQQEAADLSLSLAATAKIMERLPEMEDKDLINAKHKADIGSGIHVDKAQLLEGQPTQRVERTSDQILRELEAEGVRLDAIEVEAEEVME